jgi:uroporphyrinogen decarboxylase
MTRRERVWAALAGQPVDRPPVSFWGHFYHRESSARELVDATLEFQREYDWDWIKLNPRKHYHVEPWGVSYRYSGTPGEKPVLESCPVRNPGDWAKIGVKPPAEGALGEQIEAVRLLRAALPADVPILETVFTPLAVLGEMVREPAELRDALRTHPALVRTALEAVTATWEGYIPRLLEAGADGIFFATVDWASEDLMTAGDYRTWARATDLRALAAAAQARFNVLHVCKRRNHLLALADYPVAAFSWAATDPTNPALAAALGRLNGAVMGGIGQDAALQAASPDVVLEEYRTACEQTGGRRWLAAPGCSIPPGTPAANLRAVREAVESTRLAAPRAR